MRLVDTLRTRPWLIVLSAVVAFWTIWAIGYGIFSIGAEGPPIEGQAPEIKP